MYGDRLTCDSVIPAAKYLTPLCHQVWPSEEMIPQITNVPILFLSGLQDEIVPYVSTRGFRRMTLTDEQAIAHETALRHLSVRAEDLERIPLRRPQQHSCRGWLFPQHPGFYRQVCRITLQPLVECHCKSMYGPVVHRYSTSSAVKSW